MNEKKSDFAAVIILILLLLLALSFSLFCGVRKINLSDIFSSVRALSESVKLSRHIFFNIRLPRTVLVLIAGTLLALSGSVFQLYFRNPLAEPGIMGLSSGATLGAVIAVCCFPKLISSVYILNLGAFLGALLSGLFVTILSSHILARKSTATLLLCGTALGTLYSAFTSILLSVNDKQLHSMYMWMLGSFSGRGWTELKFIFIPAVISVVLMLFISPKLNVLVGGELSAQSLGINIKRLRFLVIVSGSLATSAAVCAGGTIGFVGLIAPHVVRIIFGPSPKKLMPLSMCLGATILLFSDTLCRIVIAPAELSVGMIMSILGAPFFISLLFTRRGLKNV